MTGSKTLTVYVVYHFCIVIQACVLGVVPVTATYEIGCLLESRLIRPFCSYRPLISSHVLTVSFMSLIGLALWTCTGPGNRCVGTRCGAWEPLVAMWGCWWTGRDGWNGAERDGWWCWGRWHWRTVERECLAAAVCVAVDVVARRCSLWFIGDALKHLSLLWVHPFVYDVSNV